MLPLEVPSKVFHVHQILLAQRGIFILENGVSDQAVADGVYEGLFTLGPSRVSGAAQAIINPIFLY